MPTIFPTHLNNLQTTLGAAYAAGSASVTLAPGYGAVIAQKVAAAGASPVSAAHPLQFTMISASAINTYGQIANAALAAVYRATGLSGDTLTGVTAVEGVDQGFSAGDTLADLLTAGDLLAIQAAVNALESAGGGVTSVFGRSGAVVAAAGDYSVGQVTGAAPLASPALTGVPTAPTAAAGTSTTQLATTAFVAGAGLTVGNPVSGGTAKAVLREDASGNLAASAALVFDPALVCLGINGTPTPGCSVVAGNVIYCGASAAASFALNSAGSYFGVAGNISAHVWGLGYNSGPNGSFTPSAQWTDTQDVLLGKSAPATSATTGFPYLPAAAGAPTGTPAAQAGFCPFLYDTTNNKLWIYNGAWKGVALS